LGTGQSFQGEQICKNIRTYYRKHVLLNRASQN
jgi:hypothetical protein